MKPLCLETVRLWKFKNCQWHRGIIDDIRLEGKRMAPTHQAAIDRLKKEGTVKWKDVKGAESRAFVALASKGVIDKVFQPYGQTFFKLPS